MCFIHKLWGPCSLAEFAGLCSAGVGCGILIPSLFELVVLVFVFARDTSERIFSLPLSFVVLFVVFFVLLHTQLAVCLRIFLRFGEELGVAHLSPIYLQFIKSLLEGVGK